MHLKIITHERVVFDEDVDEIYSKGVNGEFGVLKGHVPYITALDIGVTKAVQNSVVRMFTTMGGILQFKDNNALILTDTAEAGSDIDVTKIIQNGKPKYFSTMGGIFKFFDEEALILTETAEAGDEIDEVRARDALERARARLADATAKTEAKRAEAAIARALARLKAKLNE